MIIICVQIDNVDDFYCLKVDNIYYYPLSKARILINIICIKMDIIDNYHLCRGGKYYYNYRLLVRFPIWLGLPLHNIPSPFLSVMEIFVKIALAICY